MNIKMVLIALSFAAGVAAVIFAYNKGRDDMRAEILALSPYRDTTSATVVTTPPPDTMQGRPGVKPTGHNRARIAPDERSTPRGDQDTAGVEIIDERGGNSLVSVYSDTLTDARGGTHALTFTLPGAFFREVFTSAPDTVWIRTVGETRFVPLEPGHFWYILTGSTKNVNASLGWDFIGIGIGLQRYPAGDNWHRVFPMLTIHGHL